MAVIGWLDTEDVVRVWADAAQMDEDELEQYLAAAYAQCVDFLPEGTDVSEPTATWQLAQRLQARALFRSNIAGSGDTIGQDGMTVTVFPMDWTVKNLLRPKRIGRVL